MLIYFKNQNTGDEGFTGYCSLVNFTDVMWDRGAMKGQDIYLMRAIITVSIIICNVKKTGYFPHVGDDARAQSHTHMHLLYVPIP